MLAGFLLAGASNESGVVDDSNFWRFSGYFFGNSVFALAVLDSEGSSSNNNYVKTNERRPILSATKM